MSSSPATVDSRQPTSAVKKVLADLSNASGRAALVIIAMSAGLFAVTSIAATNTVLTRELARSFDAITPASATIRILPGPDSLLRVAAAVTGVAFVDGGRVVGARAQAGISKVPVLLFSAVDFSGIKINKLRPLTGPFPPRDGEVLFERAAVRVAGLEPGALLAVSVNGGAPVPLTFTGTVHDFSQAPAWQEGVIYGYVNRATIESLSGIAGITEVRFVVSDEPLSEPHIREVAQRVSAALTAAGATVRTVIVPRPGEHPHQSQMNALLGIQQTFGIVALLLSAALIVVLLNAMLAQHRKQIGAMKSIGASRAAIMRMYFLWVLILSALAELIALPLGLAAGRAYARFIADMLNFDIADASVPLSLLLLLILLGAVLPLLVSLLPIRRAATITTRAALQDVVAAVVPTRSRIPIPESRTRRLLDLSFANTLRSKSRLTLVVLTLSAGGALFLAALNLSESFQGTLKLNIQKMGYDISLSIPDSVEPARVLAALNTIPGIASVRNNTIARGTAADLRDASPNTFTIQGTPETVATPNLTMVSGRWLSDSDDRALVANHAWLRDHPMFHVGDSVSLRLGEDSSRWLLVGAAREVMVGPGLYAREETLQRRTRPQRFPYRTHQFRVIATNHSPDSTSRVMRAIEQRLTESKITVAGMTDLQSLQQHRDDHVVMIIAFLLTVAALSQLVGALGLATMLSVAVFERSQELGVMRAIGATRAQLMILIISEGTFVAIAGLLGAVILAIPASYALNVAFGNMMLAMPLAMHPSVGALPILLAITALVTLIAAGLPALRAANLEPRVLLTTT